MQPILLIGANGQLGSDLVKILPTVLPTAALVCPTLAELDVTDPAAVARVLEAHAPGWVINTAAFHQVDGIEKDERGEAQLAFAVNAVAVGGLARACARRGARLLHLSTDYVFGGGPPGPYAEDAPPAPLNIYGKSKLAGERLVQEASPTHLTVRSTGLYGVAGPAGKGSNFVDTMLRLARNGQRIKVVSDQILGPTYTADLATGIGQLIAANPPGGIYHLTNAGQCSWFEFAARIFALCRLTPPLEPMTSAEYGSPARRPAHSVLRNTRAAALGVPPLRPWPAALEAYLRAKGHLTD